MAATLEGALNHFIANCPLVVSVHHLMTKWRIQLKGGYAPDFYFNATSGKYSYTLSQNDNRVLGWDNAPHHPNQPNYPHHFHDTDGNIVPSQLNGDPEHDLEIVRAEVERVLAEK